MKAPGKDKMPTQGVTPEAILHRGCELLDAPLLAHGFHLAPIFAGTGSGGRFAACKYIRGDRCLEMHYRYSLGLVTYHVGQTSLDHEGYMRVLDVRDKCAYPDFPKEPLDSFRGLVRDLESYCSVFLSGTDDQFRALVERAKKQKRGLAEVP
jgi:hypothetical protein